MMITGSSAMKSEQIIVRHGLRTISRARGAVIRYERPLGVSSETETMVTLRGQANQSIVSDTIQGGGGGGRGDGGISPRGGGGGGQRRPRRARPPEADIIIFPRVSLLLEEMAHEVTDVTARHAARPGPHGHTPRRNHEEDACQAGPPLHSWLLDDLGSAGSYFWKQYSVTKRGPTATAVEPGVWQQGQRGARCTSPGALSF